MHQVHGGKNVLQIRLPSTIFPAFNSNYEEISPNRTVVSRSQNSKTKRCAMIYSWNLYLPLFPLVLGPRLCLSFGTTALRLPPEFRDERCALVAFKDDHSEVDISDFGDAQQRLTLDRRVGKTFAPFLRGRCCWCAVGLAGENATSLSGVTRLLRLVPRHAMFVSRERRPQRAELALQNRRLVWRRPNKFSKVFSRKVSNKSFPRYPCFFRVFPRLIFRQGK